MEIVPGIHSINGIRGANAYLFINEGKIIAVDTGMPGNAKRIVAYTERLGKNPSDIKFIILTHADIDHIGSAAELKKITGAKLVIHADDAPILRGQQNFKAVGGPLGFVFKLAMFFMRYHPTEPDIILNDNSEVAGFKIVHTPGHTQGSICLYLPPKVIFVGDALRSDSSGNPKPPSRNLSADMVQAKASFIKISELKFEICLTGHGAPVVGSASTKIGNLLTHLK